MDIIESGESPVRSRRRMVMMAAVALVVLGGVYALRHTTANREPPRHPAVAPTTDGVTWTPPSRGVVAAVPDEQRRGVIAAVPDEQRRGVIAAVPDEQRMAAMRILPVSDHGGAVNIVGSDFNNSNDGLGLADESLPRKGRWAIDMTCLGTGGVWVTIEGSDADVVSGDGLWIECSESSGYSTVPMTLSQRELRFTLRLTHDAVGVFAYAVRAAEAA
jgi:hypothetical protein